MCHPALAAWRVDDAEALVLLGDVAGARRLAEEHLALADRVGPARADRRRATGAGAGVGAEGRRRPARGARWTCSPAARCGSSTRGRSSTSGPRSAGPTGGPRPRSVLRRGLDLADRLGMRRLARRALDELRATGARPRRSAHSGLDALTPAEHRVAVLAADGLSNREIAQQLYVTRRTVETHLTHVFQKLGLTARADLRAPS